jgi:hypothetical protein
MELLQFEKRTAKRCASTSITFCKKGSVGTDVGTGHALEPSRQLGFMEPNYKKTALRESIRIKINNEVMNNLNAVTILFQLSERLIRIVFSTFPAPKPTHGIWLPVPANDQLGTMACVVIRLLSGA